jgi:uncharacterized membrane protein YkoI
MQRWTLGLLLALMLLPAGATARAEDAACYANWSDAAPVVRAQGLVDMERLSALASTSLAGAEIVRTTLCREQGRFVYRLVVREAKGRLKMVSVDARLPFAR